MDSMTQDYVRELFDYDPCEGTLYWKTRPISHFSERASWLRFNRHVAGSKAGSPNSNRYLTVGFYVNGKLRTFQVHRIIWLHVYGQWPDGVIDHIDGNRTNNSISNLRVVTNRDNCRNGKRRRNNQSGISGVNWHKKQQKWNARINDGCRRIHLGSFDRLEDATAARQRAEKELGYHENHGR